MVLWTHIISINDIYFDWIENQRLKAPLEGNKLRGISAGDGSTGAYKRIRKMTCRLVLCLNHWFAWLAIGRRGNRAMSDVAPSGYHSPLHLVTQQNINYDGGPKDTLIHQMISQQIPCILGK